MQSPSLPGKPLLSGSRVSEVTLSLERPSRQAPLAGVSMLWLGRPGKLLLPGPCLLGPASSSCRGPCLFGPASSSCRGPCLFGPASSSCRGLVLNAWSSLVQKGAVKTLGAPLASLAAWCYNCPCTSSGY